MTLSDTAYDRLKWIANTFLPALGTLYFALSSIWGFPYAEQLLGTATAIITFLNALLKISSSNYEGDGTLVIDEGIDLDTYRMELNDSIESLSGKNRVIFNVQHG